jgi:Big-like domain-containing protein
MTQGFQRFTKRYVNVLGVFLVVAGVSSILLNSGCNMTSNRPVVPAPTPTPDRVAPTSAITSPAPGATLSTGAAVSITGTASDSGGGTVARVEVSVDGGATFSAATGTTAWSFSFTPATPGQVRIRSRAVDNSGNTQDPPVEITVTAQDVTRPTSTITSPASGATLSTGTAVSITGTASDAGGGTVARVEVSVDGGATFSAATGTTAWSFSFTPATPGQVRIRSRAVDNSGNTQDPPAEITVTAQDVTPPTSAITSPAPGATVSTGATVNITGTASDAGGGTVDRVEVSVDGGATFSAAMGTTSWSFSFTPATPGQVMIRSRAVDNSGNQQDPPTGITVTAQDVKPPTSTITSPKAGGDISNGTAVSITGTASDAGGGMVARVDVSVDGGASFSTATGTTSWSFSFTPTTPGLVQIRSRAVDDSGNVQNPTTQITVNIVVGGTWTAQGPGPTLFGQAENVIPNNEVVGAIHTVAAHPTDANILYAGGTNSGIWRTVNATAANPNWTPLIDNFPSLSIGALEFDPTDATNRTLVAGIGRFSSFSRAGGRLTGLLRTTDGGDNWMQISHPLLVQNISGVAARGDTLLAAANFQFSNLTGGLFRSVNGGIDWVLVSGSNGLPAGGVFDLVGVPGNLNRFYVSVQRIGIFRSDNGGATWTNISSGDPTLNGIITNPQNSNAEMAVASNGRLYVVVVNTGRAQYIGFSDNPAAAAPTWTAMDLPQTPEPNGIVVGLHPGQQGSIHLAIAVDRNDPNTVYVSGDRQDLPPPPLPRLNFIGARDFSGRLFRGDTTVAPTGAVPSPQWEHLTHSNSIAQIPGGGTTRGSAPHADSREMTIAPNGDLIEVNDGGIYRRTSPQNNLGDWFSINGDIQTTEFHDVAYDNNSNAIILGGAQDTGSPVQITSGSTTWRSLSTADGGDVAVDNITLAAQNQSIRYSSFQNLGAFSRGTFDANNNFINRVFPLLTVVGGGAPLQPAFVAPVELNAIDPRRLVIGGLNSIYESFNQGDTITEIDGPGTTQLQNAIAYGGRSGGVDNLDVLYVGSGPAVFLRTTAGAALAPTAALPAGATVVRDVVLDPDDWRSAYVVDSNQVFRTTDAGASWTDITGNLPQFGVADFNTTQFVAGATANDNDLLLVGTNAGVYVSFSSSGFTIWNKLGVGLPNVLVLDLDYDLQDDVLLAGTLGRGAWTLTNLRVLTQPPTGAVILQSPIPQRRIRR